MTKELKNLTSQDNGKEDYEQNEDVQDDDEK